MGHKSITAKIKWHGSDDSNFLFLESITFGYIVSRHDGKKFWFCIIVKQFFLKKNCLTMTLCIYLLNLFIYLLKFFLSIYSSTYLSICLLIYLPTYLHYVRLWFASSSTVLEAYVLSCYKIFSEHALTTP